MSVKISDLPVISSLSGLSTAIFPVTAGNASLTTYQTSITTVKNYVQTGNLAVTGNISAQLDSTFGANLTIIGNLVVQGNTSIIGSNNVATTDNILELHVPNVANIAQPWLSNDGKDIGIRFHYYDTADNNAALVMANDSRYLEWYNAGSEGNTTFAGTSYGTMKMGALLLANSTVTTANATGALQVSGGISTGGNLWVTGWINGSSYISTTGTGTFSSIRANTNSNIGGTLIVSGATTLQSLSVNTTASVGSTLVVTSNATVNGLAINNSATVGTTLSVGSTLTTAAITASGTVQPNANATVALGGTSNYWGSAYINSLNVPTITGGTFSGVSTTAKYADLAEKYVADAQYTPGTVVVFGGTEEITISAKFADTRVAGAISTDPAYLMNSESAGLSVALRGKIPVDIVGPVAKGDLLVTSETAGAATSVGHRTDYSPNAVFAKSLVDDLAVVQRTIWAVVI